jgi:hypothetical protein
LRGMYEAAAEATPVVEDAQISHDKNEPEIVCPPYPMNATQTTKEGIMLPPPMTRPFPSATGTPDGEEEEDEAIIGD